MKTRKIALGLLAALAVAGAAGWFSLDKETRGLLATLPTNRDVLFWSQPQRDAAFRALDRLPVLAKSRVVPAGGTPTAAAAGAAAEAAARRRRLHGRPAQRRPADRARRQAAPGALRPRLRRQRPLDQLLGRQVDHLDPGRRGHPRRPHPSMDDKVSDYIPEMKGSAYDDVSIRQLLTMTSGVQLERGLRRPELRRGAVQQPPARGRRRRAGELPAAPAARGAGGHALELQHRRDQPRRRPAQPGDEEAAGDLPVGKDLGAGRHGAAGDLDPQPHRARRSAAAASRPRRATSPASALFILDGARVDGQSIVPDGWLAEATSERTGIGQPGRGYGYQWWTYTDGTLRRARHLRPGHLHRPEAQDRDRLQRQLGAAARPTASPARRARRSTARCRRRSTTRLQQRQAPLRGPNALNCRWLRAPRNPDILDSSAGTSSR